MAETLTLCAGTKEERYAELLPQIEAIVKGENDVVANMANMSAMLWEAFAPHHFPQTGNAQTLPPMPWMWVGFYRVVGDELVLGPFQGPLACTRIKKWHGVCGTAWAENRTVIVPDVEKFPGHIACSSASKSEIVVPVHNAQGEVTAVLDIDSSKPATFDKTDKVWLEQIVKEL